MTAAVLVIDIQQGLCEGEEAAFDVVAVIQRINQVTAKARAAGAPVIFVQHEAMVGYLAFQTDAWQLAKGLQVAPSDLRLRKRTPDSFHQTELEMLLVQHGVYSLVICGIYTEFCIDSTMRRALALGYPAVLVADAHTSAGNAHLTPAQVIAHHNLTLTGMSSYGGRARAVAAADVRFDS